MGEFAIATQLKDEPLALMVLGALITYKILIEVIKHILPLITKKKPLRELLEEDAKIRIKRQEELDERLVNIEKGLAELSSNVVDLETELGKTSQGTLENQLFSPYRDNFVKLKAFMRLIGLRKNGEIKAEGFKIILSDKKMWRCVQGAHIDMKIVDQAYFDETMKEIERRIFDQ